VDRWQGARTDERLIVNGIEGFVLSSPPDSFATQLPNQSLSAFAKSVARFFCRTTQMFEALLPFGRAMFYCGDVTV
jgi:hypothetical protein